MRWAPSSDDVQTIPIAQVVREEHRHRGVREKIYGKTSRRRAIAKLRQTTDCDRAPPTARLGRNEQQCCGLTEVMVNQAVEMHDQQHSFGTFQSPPPKIASDMHNLSLIKLDVEKVGPSSEVAKRMEKKKSSGDEVSTGQAQADNPKNSKPHNDTEEAMKSDVNRIRGYMDLLDEYSLHHFIIWNGKVIRDTPEFTSLARTYQASWSSIDRCVSILEEIMTVNSVPLAIIDGKQLGELARFDLERVDEADLCSVISNFEQIKPLLRHTRIVPNGPSAAQLAAITIQATVRRFIQRSGFLLLQSQRNSVVKLQRLARGRRSRRFVAGMLHERRRKVESRWQELQDGLRADWESLRGSERVVILLLSTANEDARGPRRSCMHWLVDPCVHVVCVLASPPDDDVLEYHRKILEMAGIHGARGRMAVVVPENVELFQGRLPLTSTLLYSPESLQRIARIVKGRPAVMITGEAGWQDKRLAVALGVPLLSADPSVALLLQTQSGMKRVFAAADVSAPVGAHDVYDEEDLMVALTKLIACNLEVRRWYIKLDACRGNRGLAVLDTSSLACVPGLKREKAQLERANGGPTGVWHHPDVQLLARARLLKTLRRCLHRVLSICRRDEFPTWEYFLGHLSRGGGVIEAEAPEKQSHPSCNVFVSPIGEITCLAETEMLFDGCHQRVGCMHPQACVSSNALRGAAVAVSRELCKRGVIGYASIHFVVFWDEKARAPRLWATGLELGLSASAFSYCFFRSLTKSSRNGRDFGCYDEFPSGSDDDEGLEGRDYFQSCGQPRIRSGRDALHSAVPEGSLGESARFVEVHQAPCKRAVRLCPGSRGAAFGRNAVNWAATAANEGHCCARSAAARCTVAYSCDK